MFNNSNNFAFPMVQCHYLPMINQQLFPSMNYQETFMTPYFWMDQNLAYQPYQTFITFEPQTFIASQMSSEDFKINSSQSIQQDTNKTQKLTLKDKLHFYPISNKYNIKLQKLTTKSSGAFTLCSPSQENLRLNQEIVESNPITHEKTGEEINNEIFAQDKKTLQNLRYQRKNIQANVVNKIYTRLKMILKFGQKSVQNLLNNREKSITFFKVLQKLEKAKKQIIKRQYLKALIQIDESLPGYTKVLKQLQRKGQSIKQFEYYIRVIIRNYLRNEASNSILTSKKMNPSLWIDHLRKVREIQEYLFSHPNKKMSTEQSIPTDIF